jgi:hypothetical protein
MPDKYGFETREDREFQRQEQEQRDLAARERGARLFQQHDAMIQDILQHYLQAYELDEQYDMVAYAERGAWAIGARGSTWDAKIIRVQLIADEDDRPMVAIMDFSSGGLPSEDAIGRLGDALNAYVQLPVVLLDSSPEAGAPPRRTWPTSPVVGHAGLEEYTVRTTT